MKVRDLSERDKERKLDKAEFICWMGRIYKNPKISSIGQKIARRIDSGCRYWNE